MSSSALTTSHAEIRTWIETRGGRPCMVRSEGDDGILRIDFGAPDDRLEEIDWETFFRIFDDSKLAFFHQDKTTEGKTSRFNKFVSR